MTKRAKSEPDSTKLVARSTKQAALIAALRKEEQVFALGPAGTGKTYLATAVGLERIYQRKLVLIRPVVGADEDLGFLPGDIHDKMLPWMMPFVEIIKEIAGAPTLARYMNSGQIEIVPIAYARGRTFTNATVIVDEAQNATLKQLELILTRVGENSTIYIAGDHSQSDLGAKSGLKALAAMAEKMNLMVMRFAETDVVRSRVCRMWTEAFSSPTSTTEYHPNLAS